MTRAPAPLDTETESFKAPTSPALGLDIETKPFEEDPQEAEHDPEESLEEDPSEEDHFEEDPTEEDPTEEDPTEEDEPLSAQDLPTPPTQTAPTIPTLIIQPWWIPSFRPYRIHPNETWIWSNVIKLAEFPSMSYVWDDITTWFIPLAKRDNVKSIVGRLIVAASL
ncbi:hypothetical protein Tco_0387009 [Tanacetum coccineum]